MIAENPPRRHWAAIGAGAALLLVTAAVSLTSRPASPQQLSMGDMIGYFAALLKAEPGRPIAGMNYANPTHRSPTLAHRRNRRRPRGVHRIRRLPRHRHRRRAVGPQSLDAPSTFCTPASTREDTRSTHCSPLCINRRASFRAARSGPSAPSEARAPARRAPPTRQPPALPSRPTRARRSAATTSSRSVPLWGILQPASPNRTRRAWTLSRVCS